MDPVMYECTTNSNGKGVHFLTMLTFGWGTLNKWFGMISFVTSNQYAPVKFSTCPLNGTETRSRSNPDCLLVVTSARYKMRSGGNSFRFLFSQGARHEKNNDSLKNRGAAVECKG